MYRPSGGFDYMRHKLKAPISSLRIAEVLALEHRGGPVEVVSVCNVSSAESQAMMFMKCAEINLSCKDAMVIAPAESKIDVTCAHLISARPRFDFMRALYLVDQSVGFLEADTAPVIHPTARVSVHASIANGVHIGANTVIEPYVYLHAGTRIGSNCLIRCGADIGGDGFGYERLDDGTPLKFVHLGGVLIGNHVEIGANSCVARGALSDTVIDDHAKIDNLVHIAHNCYVGRGAFVIAGAEVSGGVQIGAGAWIGPNAAIIQKVDIGAGATVGIGAVVTRSIPEQQTVAGSPAQEISEFIRHRKLIASLR
jgi:UDP-3-O-[3-hydroxymyristoyl] glucosamine N-acyltransferase